MLESFVVGQVSWPCPIEDRADEARMFTTDTTRGLDVFRRCFRLAEDDHETETDDIETDGDHVRGNRDVNVFLLGERERQPPRF